MSVPPTVHNLIAEMLSPALLSDLLFGTAELTVQLLGFSIVCWFWQSRRQSHTGIVGRLIGVVTDDPPKRGPRLE